VECSNSRPGKSSYNPEVATLDDPVSSLAGIGPKRAERLAREGIRTVEDLLFHVPFRYEDRSNCSKVVDLRSGSPATIRAQVLSPRLLRTRRRGFTIMQALLDDGTGAVRAVWYNQPYLERVLQAGQSGWFFGEPQYPSRGSGAIQLMNPEIEMIPREQEDSADAEPEPIHTGRLVPVYRSVAGLGTRTLRRLVHHALESIEEGIEDFLPAVLRKRHGLTWRASALAGIHFPPEDMSFEELQAGSSEFHRRLVFEEFFLFQLGLALRRRTRRAAVRGFQYRFSEEMRRRIASFLPFPLTEAQRRVFREIRQDMESTSPMNRLLQGDVGSGKTVVAALGLAIAAENGLQGALMAPTEILAQQHHERLSALFGPAGYRIGLLTSAVRGGARRVLLEQVENGTIAILIGTHALLSSPVRFRRLGLAVIDEQHRFGVSQRSALRGKGGGPECDTLVMTATPIPRSLALTLYGDLDLSVLDEMPPGRTTIKTLRRGERHRERVYEGIRRELERGRQAFIIYPLVKETDASGMKAAVEMASRLRSGAFEGYRVACVHGRMDRAERDSAMKAFSQGIVQVLVATTVVEVGIDVPNATVLVVEHPERFGLTQLHQLRGRVGRGPEKSYCILMAGDSIPAEASLRLDALVDLDDGFRISERDFELRGPGDVLGTRQHGVLGLRIGSLVADARTMELARREAVDWLERLGAGGTGGPGIPPVLARKVAQRFGERLDLVEVS
jgi:ATP-dependent DNA helicase RecG